MTEVTAAYYEDVAKRADVKKSAYHKKNGSAVAKLGNKPMSWQEINAKHGECKTYKLDTFYSYDEFVAMPNDIKIEYVNKLCDQYDIDMKHISRYLFNKGDDGLRQYLRINKLLEKCNPSKKRGKTNLKKFIDDIAKYRAGESFSKILDLAEEKPKGNEWNFITYEGFLKYSIDERVEYVNSMIDRYGVPMTSISETLFGKNEATLGVYFKSHKVLDKIHKVQSVINKNEIKANKIRFDKLVNEWKGESKPSEPAVKTPTPKPKPEVKPEPVPAVEIKEEVTPVIETPKEEPIPEIKMEVPEPVVVKEPPMKEYNDMHFGTSYISNGIDLDQLNMLSVLFGNRKIRVNIDITVL